MENTKTCIVCYDDEESANEGEFVVLSGCEHQICAACLKRWLRQCELQFKKKPVCPDCKNDIGQSQAAKTLGRAYEALQQSPDENERAIINDMALETWLEENDCRQCGNCGSHIQREAGCDAVMCLCGYRFCWECKVSAEFGCECYHEDYYDNIRGYDTDIVRSVASPSQLLDLKTFMKQWKDSDDDSDSASGSEEDDDAMPSEEVYEEVEDAYIGSILDYEELEELHIGSIFDSCEEEGQHEQVPKLEAESGSESEEDKVI